MSDEHAGAIALCDEAERAEVAIEVAREAVSDARLMGDVDGLVLAMSTLDRARRHRARSVESVCALLDRWWRLAPNPTDHGFPSAA